MFGGALLTVGTLLPASRTARAAAQMVSADIDSYRAALAHMAQSYRFALVDIRADWCAVCHRIERDILSHPSVRDLLERVALLKVDVTAMDEGNKRLLSYLRADGPPTFFIVDTATGAEYAQTRSVGSFRRYDLVRRLRPFART